MLSQTRNELRAIDIGALGGVAEERGGHLASVKGAPVYVPRDAPVERP
jgi:hypothetical protein